MRSWTCLAAALGMLLGGCGAARYPTVAGTIPGGVEAFLAAHPLAAGQALRIDEVSRSPSASWHLVQVAGAETPHRHRFHDLSVFVLRGEGVLTLDGREIPLRAGDAAVVPRERPHWFARRGPRLAVSLAVFTPPLDAPDLVPEPAVDTMGGRR
jgi:mannose-6-phosphate isomerase-like protein (cupin superfamily)